MSRDDLLHHPRPELVPNTTLDRMERDGWTPTQVRQLIASYRALRVDWALARGVLEMPAKHVKQAHRDLTARVEVKQMLHWLGIADSSMRAASYELVERELRELKVTHVAVMYFEHGASEMIKVDATGDRSGQGTLLQAVDALAKEGKADG